MPGRIEILGKHTGYAGGRSLLAAVPRGMAVIARARSGDVVRLHDVRDGQRIEVDPSRPAPPGCRGLRRYVHVVARRLFLNFPGCALGADIAIASDLPRASGLSSSSALVCGVASALARRAALGEREEWQAHIPTVTALAWYLGCVENGLDFQGLPGASGVGTHGGSEDHTAIMTGRLHHVSQYQFVPVTPLGDVPMPGDWSFVIASSGVQADKADSVRERYNRAANGVRALHAAWNARAEHPARSLAAALGSAPGAVARLRNWIADSADDPVTNQDLSTRLQHFVNEDARVPSAAQAFASSDTAAIGRLVERVAARRARAAGQPDSGDDGAGRRGVRGRRVCARAASAPASAAASGPWSAPATPSASLANGSSAMRPRCRPWVRCRGSRRGPDRRSPSFRPNNFVRYAAPLAVPTRFYGTAIGVAAS